MQRLRWLMAAAVAAALLVPAVPADAAAQQVEIQEWEVPWEQSRPRDPYMAPDGRVWFVGQRSDYAAVLDPRTGEFERFDLPEGAGPHTLIVDDEGIVWYAGNRANHIGRLDPATGEITQYKAPDATRDPHTMIFGDGGKIYFTAQGANQVGQFDMATGEYVVRDVPTPRARPYGIARSPDGNFWVAMVGTHKLLRIDPTTMEIQEVELSREEATPRRIQTTSDGRVWYVDYAGGYLGAYNPRNGQIREWKMPRGDESRPYGMQVDSRDRLWFVETGPRDRPNQLVGFDPETQQFIAHTEIPSGGGTIRHMYYDESSNSIWFGTDANTIGVARLPR